MPRKSTAPTRRDVAQLAGVTETIVSYVMNDNRYVSAEKRKRVLDAVAQLHYRPNYIARALKGKGSSQILFIADNVTNDYFGRLIREIDDISYDKGYTVSLMGARNDPDFVTRIISRQPDGVIISSSNLSETYIQELVDSGMPVVLLMTRDYASLHGRIGRIYTGIESGIMASVRLLYEGGCRHMVHVDRVSEHGRFSTRQDLRYRGFCNQMEVLGLSLGNDSFISGCKNYDEVFQAVCDRIKSNVPVDSFVCRNDRLACTVLNAVLSCGKTVPSEISIIGFDDSDLSRFIHPSLSTVAHDRHGIAHAVFQALESMIEGVEPEEYHLVTSLVPRETTKKI